MVCQDGCVIVSGLLRVSRFLREMVHGFRVTWHRAGRVVVLSGGLSMGSAFGEVRVSLAPGWVARGTTVVLGSTFQGERLRYTTNGSMPTATQGWDYREPIVVNHSMVLRVAAFRDSALPSAPQTFTYLVSQDVLRQTGLGFPEFWGVTNGIPVRADYAMDPEVLATDERLGEADRALQALPIVSVVAEPDDWFDSERGIYANPRSSGDEWERSASLEMEPAVGQPLVSIPCGVRIQGGWNRRPEESPKHALRLVFRRKYGASELKMDVFGGGVQRFETLILRAGCNNTWLHWSGEERSRGDYLRDQWMRETYGAMGQLSARGKFVHLFLNGLYWGIYNLAERPSAPFVAAHLGGKASEYDSRNGENILEGTDKAWRELFRMVNSGVREMETYRRVERLLDLDAFADFMLLNLYGGNGDWDRVSNWYAARRRSEDGRFLFLVWDGERTLEKVEDSILGVDDDLCPTRLFQRLRENPEFRSRFSRRARKHLAGDGVLGPKASAGRYRVMAELLDGPILAESARWGDYRRDFHPYKVGPYELYTREHHWRPEVRRLLEEYFPKRTAALIRQLESAGLYE